MNRTDIVILTITATLTAFMLFGDAFAGPQIESVHQHTTQLMESSFRVVKHSKSVVIESLTLAKHSISLALDIAIESL